MNDAEVQRRFQAGELVFTDGRHVFIRGVRLGYKDKEWEITDPTLCGFENEPEGMAGWCASKRSWTQEHSLALVAALRPYGIELPFWITETREVRR